MELDFTADQEELRDARARGARSASARRRSCGSSSRRASPASRRRADGLWQQMVELGWPALTVPEAAGGLGLGAVELAVVVEELGRAIAPGPLLPTISQFVPAVRDARRRRAAGPLPRPGRRRRRAPARSRSPRRPAASIPARSTATATPARATAATRSPGVKHGVIEARRGDRGRRRRPRSPARRATTGSARSSCRATRCDVVADRGARREPRPRDRHARRRRGRAPTGSSARPGPTTAAALRRVVRGGDRRARARDASAPRSRSSTSRSSTRSSASSSACRSARSRRPSTSSPTCSSLLERARALGYFAALTIAEDDERRADRDVDGEGRRRRRQRSCIAKEGIQIHGGIGYTWEHDMHLYVRRAAVERGALRHRAAPPPAGRRRARAVAATGAGVA